MKLYNSWRQSVEEFKSIDEEIKMYYCGPTVYDVPHVGNARSAFSADLLRRYFKYLGRSIKFVSNYTDIDDKMINRANERGITVKELADEIIPLVEKSWSMLRVNLADVRPLATSYIQEMMDFVAVLIDKGFAYEIEDGIYFRVDAYEDYGQLSGQDLEMLDVGSRIQENLSKENPRDFVLWKFKKEGEPFWEDKNGVIKDGRPGWHIECSVMIEEVLGSPIDIHAGGEDLKFPHHECEMAQTDACKGNKLANYWFHNGFLNMSGEKMSKSLGNIKTVLDLIRMVDPLDIRYLFLSGHYRHQLDFSDATLKQSHVARMKLQNLWDRLNDMSVFGEGVSNLNEKLEDFKSSIEGALSDDLNTPKALGFYFEFVKYANTLLDEGVVSNDDSLTMMDFMKSFESVFDVIRTEMRDLTVEEKDMISKRKQAREEKNYELSDKLRDELLASGIQVLDGAEGSNYRVIL